MASGATGPVSMELALPNATRKATGGSPPAKRWNRATENPAEKAMQDTLDDHATKIDQHHQALRGMAATSKAAFEAIEEKDSDLRQRLMVLEAQVVKNENTITTVARTW